MRAIDNVVGMSWDDFPQDIKPIILGFSGQEAQQCLYRVNRELHHLVRQHVTAWQAEAPSSFRFAMRLPSLSRLTIRFKPGDRFGEDELQAIVNKTKLVYLKIDRTSIPNLAWQTLTESPSLRKLKLCGIGASRQSILAIANSLTLESFSLNYLRSLYNTMISAEVLAKSPSLKHLSFRERNDAALTQCPPFNHDVLKALSCSGRLDSLDLRGHFLAAEDIQMLRNNKALTSKYVVYS